MGKKAIRIICNILIVIFAVGFVVSLLWFVTGSFEMVPTEEQEEKARLAALTMMGVFGMAGGLCAAMRAKRRKNME